MSPGQELSNGGWHYLSPWRLTNANGRMVTTGGPTPLPAASPPEPETAVVGPPPISPPPGTPTPASPPSPTGMGLRGLLRIAALLGGISRSAVWMVGGLWRGLDHEDVTRFAFLLATPIILAVGALKLPGLAGSAGARIHGQVIAGVMVPAIAAYLSVRYQVRYLQT